MVKTAEAIRTLLNDAPIPDVGLARAITYRAVESFWSAFQKRCLGFPKFALRPLFPAVGDLPLIAENSTCEAQGAGIRIAVHDAVTAGFMLGCLYTALLPKNYRAAYGVYYTPPALTRRLLDMAAVSGADWSSAKVLDPACGGGAFLGPVALRMQEALAGLGDAGVIRHIGRMLRGWEIDPFSAWLSQVCLDAALLPVCARADSRLPVLVDVRDTLAQVADDTVYDAVIGNPPYGRVRISDEQRHRFGRSLYGHANLYGLFTDQALRHTRSGGVIAFVTPTSFLAGQYFKNLRMLLASEAPPCQIDFVATRTGVFENVLQETVLAAYRKGVTSTVSRVSVLQPDAGACLQAVPVGKFHLPAETSAPWVIPRSAQQADLVERMAAMPYRLRDYRYRVSTGPLVWNRHKSQLRNQPGSSRYPLIWAEAVSNDGRFVFRADRKNHQHYFQIDSDTDEWLKIHRPCVLLQRTTAKEQSRRLIAAALPAAFIHEHGAVVVENHLNMIIPLVDAPLISPPTLARLLNSRIVDRAFRCISGSVAVSAYELEALPLPSPRVLLRIEHMLTEGIDDEVMEKFIEDSYRHARAAAAA